MKVNQQIHHDPHLYEYYQLLKQRCLQIRQGNHTLF